MYHKLKKAGRRFLFFGGLLTLFGCSGEIKDSAFDLNREQINNDETVTFKRIERGWPGTWDDTNYLKVERKGIFEDENGIESEIVTGIDFIDEYNDLVLDKILIWGRYNQNSYGGEILISIDKNSDEGEILIPSVYQRQYWDYLTKIGAYKLEKKLEDIEK